MNNKIEEIRDRHADDELLYPVREWSQEHHDRAYLLSEVERLQEENKVMKEALEWTKRKFEKEWTYEMGIGEVVDDIIRRFENAAEANRGL